MSRLSWLFRRFLQGVIAIRAISFVVMDLLAG